MHALGISTRMINVSGVFRSPIFPSVMSTFPWITGGSRHGTGACSDSIPTVFFGCKWSLGYWFKLVFTYFWEKYWTRKPWVQHFVDYSMQSSASKCGWRNTHNVVILKYPHSNIQTAYYIVYCSFVTYTGWCISIVNITRQYLLAGLLLCWYNVRSSIPICSLWQIQLYVCAKVGGNQQMRFP